MSMKYYEMIPGDYPENYLLQNEDEFIGNGWSVKKAKNKYFLTYISGALQGKLNTIEISKDDYLLVKEKCIGLDELCIRYNVF